MAAQASGAVTVRYGDTILLATVVISSQLRPDIDFLPLTVDFEEKLYAIGKIPGSFFRREGRPSQEAILSARLVDRPMRPLFLKGLHNDIQIVLTVLSADRENLPEFLGIIGASAAVSVSEIPFNGPVGATKVAYLDGEYIINPTFSQSVNSQLSGIVAGTRDGVVMVEVGASEAPEEVVLEAIRRAQEANQQVIDLIDEVVQAIGKPKLALPAETTLEELQSRINGLLDGRLAQLLEEESSKVARKEALQKLEAQVLEGLAGQYDHSKIKAAFQAILKKLIRARILDKGIRPDGRGLTDIRPISCEIGVLPRTHGSGLFTRGLTQVLTIATLASMRMEQTLDTLSPESTKRFIHHYNFPPFSTGETGRLGTGRREIGHGALAERAIQSVVPTEEEFPYTIRLVSEALSSNGSTSMASVCGSSLALMDAGVPIRCPVAGVAMGLVVEEGDRYAVLTDIEGIEDMLGDMDFKVAGTSQGVNALQMDLKIRGLSYHILERALEQARAGRMSILEKMTQAIATPRSDLSPYAPKMLRISIPTEKIGAVIGPGGRMIRSIIEETGATVDIDDQGMVMIGGSDDEKIQKARQRIENLTRDLEVGEIFTGKVVRLASFGAFVELVAGKDGLLRAEEMGEMENGLKVGEEITVVIQEIDSMGRINLSRRALFGDSGNRGSVDLGPGRPSLGQGPRGRGPSRGPRDFGQRREHRGSSFGGSGFRNRPSR